MGNCLNQVKPSFSLDKNGSLFDLGDYQWNYSFENTTYGSLEDYSSLDSAAPCHSCNLLDDSSLPFFILSSVLGILASGAVLFGLLRPLFHWQLCPAWPFLAQIAVGSGLFSIVVPILAPGLNSSQSTILCHLGYWIWYSSAFAQALLIGCHACLGPKLGTGQIPGLTLGLTVGLWGVAALLGLPVTLAIDTTPGPCTLSYSRGLDALRSTHVVACFAIFSLLPLSLLGAKGLKRVLGRGPGPWIDILWVWFIFWWPHGVILGFDSLVRAKVLLLPTCLVQQILDLTLDLAEALAMLHCVATPLLLALFFHQATQSSFPSLPLSARRSSHLDNAGSKT
ncbi:PREDICTED: atypical chemokine receptor 1 [Chinchilla lanigera]|uniref:Atypical chemokine receptor 1 n=1 Tax=Chinchilla lanigera TaxID=34839 RepID=A0A8C2VPL5_CHILA|nr:PREDICTED: atypical chemokine receptor 1 [Chinchilla lanigera]